MASLFPDNPEINDEFTINNTTWKWDGIAWRFNPSSTFAAQSFTNIATSPDNGTIVADSATDLLTLQAGENITILADEETDTLTISANVDPSEIDGTQIIITASAAAFASASAYTNSEIDSLTTSDIEEGSNLYFTNQRAIDATESIIASASAQALSEANSYTDSASASLISYTDSEINALQIFSNIGTSPSSQVIVGDSNSDTLTFIAGENISILADSSTDSITINSTGEYTNVDSVQYPDYIAFDTTPEIVSASPGTISWNSGDGGLSAQLNNNLNVTIGQEIIALCYNGEATTLNKGEVVMVSGAQGQRPRVIRAYNTSDAGSARTFGIVAENIASGGEGYVVTQGIVTNINTDGFNEGDPLYLSSTPGQLTTTKPQAPNHYVWVGVVLKKNSSSGRIYVKPQNGYELDEIHDVRITSVAAGDIIVWNSASSLWLNQPLQTYLTSASNAAVTSANDYTDAEILSASSSLISYTNQEIANLVDSAPEMLDTLNELAAALGDDENFATTVINTISSASANAISSANSYTDTEVSNAIVSASAAAVAYADGLTTTDIEEGSNLYFTDLRALQTASTALVHNNHNNLTATFNSASNIIILEGSSALEYQTEPPVTDDIGALWFDPESNGLYVYDGTYWINAVGPQGPVGPVGPQGPQGIQGEPGPAPDTSEFLTIASASSTYATIFDLNNIDLSPYLTLSSASSTYAPLDSATFTGTIDFLSASVIGIDALPSQLGEDGKYLKTDGTNASWETLDLDAKADKNLSIDSKSSNFFIDLTQNGKLIEVLNDRAISIRADVDENFPIGAQITFLQTNSGIGAYFDPRPGVTLNGTPGLRLRAQWSSATLIKRAANTWVVIGDLTA